MNELVVPPAPHWYKNSILTCSPDNTLVYGSKNDIVIIKEKDPGEPAFVRIIYGAHAKHITSVSLNRRWKEPHSYIASLGEDHVIKIWDLETLEKKTSNKDLTEHKDAAIGAVFAGDDRVVSATSAGFVVVWNINTNESKPLVDLFKGKVNLTCLSSCPHVGWLLAFGLSTGGVVVADLRRNGQVLYRLRGHYQSVVSLSWCPAPVNVFPKSVNNVVKNKSQESAAGGDTSSVTPEESLQKEDKKVNPWAGLVSCDNEEVPVEDVDDFLKECDALKKKILGVEKILEVTTPKKETTEVVRSETPRTPHVVQNRPFPQVFDVSVDFLDDLSCDCNTEVNNGQGSQNQSKEEGSEEGAENLEQSDMQLTPEDSNNSIDNTGPSSSNVEQTDLQTTLNSTQNEDFVLNPEDSSIINDVSPSVSVEPIEEEPRTEYLLASSGKDRSVYIWRAGTDGRMQTFFYTSKKPNRREKNPNSWISVCWATPDTLITSSATAQVIAWSIPKPKDPSKQSKIIHNEHSQVIFNIATPPKYLTAYNWRDPTDLSIWSWGHDGKLLNFDTKEGKVQYLFETVTAGVTSFASSLLDPNRLAVGLRDGGIRVWDLSLPHTNNISMQKFQQKFTHKVSSIGWHPFKEMIIGFGTEEGRVGYIDLVSKRTTLFPHYFRNQVYKVEWGPLMGDTINLGLYVVAEGKIAIYNIQKPDENPAQLELPAKIFAYNFAWKPDHSLLLLNGKDGCLILLKPDLTAINTIYPNEKGLNAIVWHPDAFTNQTDISPRCTWFAAATSKGVLVFDSNSIQESESFADKLVAVFEGHLKPVLALAWCPLEGNKVVSVAADGLAHVWDVCAKTAVATISVPYVSPSCAVAWSPIEADLIIIGDKLLRICSISKNPPQISEEFLANRKKLLAKIGKKDVDKTEKNKIKVEIQTKPKSNPKNHIVPAFYVSNDENIASQVANMRKIMNLEEKQGTEGTSLDPFQIFGSKEDVMVLLEANYQQQKKEGKQKSCELISLWKGNIGEYVRNAINENRVTSTIVTLAPMVSPKLWQEACLSYAKKMADEPNSDPLEVAMYFLACHKVFDAIDILCSNFMFREALALTKQRLPDGNEFTKGILAKWAVHCTTTGNFENAAYCYIANKDYENAAKVLSRRNQKEFLEFAVELAQKSGNKGLYESIKFKLDEQASQSVPETELPSRVDAMMENMTLNDSESSSTIENESEDETENDQKVAVE